MSAYTSYLTLKAAYDKLEERCAELEALLAVDVKAPIKGETVELEIIDDLDPPRQEVDS